MTKRKADEQEADDAATSEEQPGGTPYIAKVEVSPPDDPETEQPDQKPAVKLPRGSVRIVYKGSADLYEFGEHQFRPGQPVVVPSAAAEEILTTPNEPFVIVEEDSADASRQG